MNDVKADKIREKYSELIECKDRQKLSQKIYINSTSESLEIFSHLRANLIEWLPFKKSDKVLIVGEDKGIYSSVICKKVEEVDVIGSNYENCILTEERCSDVDNVRCICVSFADVKQDIFKNTYDFIMIADPYLVERNGYENRKLDFIIGIIKFALKKDGILIWGAHNQMGLKYWAGCKSKVADGYFSDIENYSGKNVEGNPSYNDLEVLAEYIPLDNKKIYYPYPDLIYPTSIYSDSFLPRKNELTKNAFSWEERIITFNEIRVWNNIIRNGLFRQLSNAFLLIMSNDEEKLLNLNLFTKYSNDRAKEYSIRTDIFWGTDKKKHIRKKACTKSARKHIANMLSWEDKLKVLYSDTKLEINKIEFFTEEEIIFEYIDGVPFLQKLEKLLSQDDYESFQCEFEKFAKPLLEKSKKEFVMTDEFADVFGYIDFPAGLKVAEVADIDLILSNMMQSSGDRIEIIDYEWVFDFPIPTNFMIYRSIEYLFRGPRGGLNFNGLYMSKLYDYFEIDEEQISAYKQMETNFQNFVCGEHMPLRYMNRTVPEFILKKAPRVYYNFGKGFDVRTSYFCDGVRFGKGSYKSRIAIPYGVKKIRIDPSEEQCIVAIKKINWGDSAGDNSIGYKVNGFEIGDNMYLFDTNDSQIVIEEVPETKKCLDVEMTIVDIEDEMAHNLLKKCNVSV